MNRKILFFLPVLLLGSCAQASSSTFLSSSSSSSSTSSSLISTTSSSSVNPDGSYELPYAPKEAPEDYLGKTPLDYLEMANDAAAFELYHLIDHRLTNSNFVSNMYGTARAGGLYTQEVASMKIVSGTTGLNHLVAIASSPLGGSIAVNSAEQRLEDVQQEKYAYRQGDGSTAYIDEERVGIVSTWSEKDSEIFSRNSYLQMFGHDLFGLTNYFIATPSDILRCELTTTTGGYTFDFVFRPEAGRFYQIEQEHMINIAGSELTITSLEAQVTIDEDFRPLTLAIQETYKVSVASFIDLDINSSFQTTFEYFGLDEEIPSTKAKSIYDEALLALL